MIGIAIGNFIGKGSVNSHSSLFTELIDGIPVSMIKRVRTKDAVELYCVDLKLTDTGFPGVEDTDYEMIYNTVVDDWIPQSLVVEDAAPTQVVMTGLIENTYLVASDFTIAGFTIDSLSRDVTNKIITLTLSASVVYGDVLNVVYKGVSYLVTNNVAGTVLTQKLIVTPDVYTDELNATTGWTLGGNVGYTTATNTTEKYSGTGSIKMTTASGGNATITKAVGWNISSDSGYSLKLWVYPHSVPSTTINYIEIKAAKDNTFGDFYYIMEHLALPPLVQNKWNLLTLAIPTWTVGAGAPNFNNIGIVRLTLMSKAGQIASASFDLMTTGEVIKKAALIMFDDASITQYTKALPILQAKNMVATVYAISDLIGTVGYMSTAQLQELYANKWDIGNHTKDHTDLSTLTEAQQEAEFVNCKSVLDGLGLTRASSHVAYPGGTFNADTLTALAATGMETGRKLSLRSIYSQRVGWPFEVECMPITNVYTSADVTGFVDRAIKSNTTPIFLFHKLVDAAPGAPEECLVSVFSDTIDKLDSEGYQTLTIDEYYRLYSGSITVNHK